MAFSYDEKTEASAVSSGLTVSHFTDSAANLIVCGIGVRGSQTITSITYGGVALTSAVEEVDSADPERAAIYYLVDPPTGSNNLVVSLSGSVGHHVSISTWISDDGTQELDAVGQNSSEGGVANPSVTCDASTGLLGVDFVSSENNNSPPFSAAGGDQTQLHNVGSGSYGIGSSYELSPASGEVFNWTSTGGADVDTWCHVAAIFIDGVGGAPALTASFPFRPLPVLRGP